MKGKIIEISYDKIINRWGLDNKGQGVITCVPPFDFVELIVLLLERMSSKNPNIRILIGIEDISVREQIVKAIESAQIKYQKLSVLTFTYISLKWTYRYDIAITYGRNYWDVYVERVLNDSKYRLMILNKITIEVEDLAKIYKNLPAVNTINATDVKNLIAITPVKEENIPVPFTNLETKAAYEKATEYISETIQIFNSFENIEKARKGYGDVSATDYVNELAAENGWRSDLDMSIPFNVEIDNSFNPEILRERARTCYNIIRERANLATDNDAKLQKIVDIFEERKYVHKKVLICSKRGEFAYIISQYLTEKLLQKYFKSCGNYHDNIPSMKLVDEQGNPVIYKTGINAGKQKIVSHQYISTDNLNRFRQGTTVGMDALSIKNASSSKLSCAVDVIIFTSPMMDFEAFKERFPDVTPKGKEIEIITLYTEKSIEERELNKREYLK